MCVRLRVEGKKEVTKHPQQPQQKQSKPTNQTISVHIQLNNPLFFRCST